MTILVTGATGSVGRKVVDQLVARGVSDIRALTVNPDRAALPAGVVPVRGNLRKPDSLDGVFDGVDRIYLAPAPEVVGEVLERAAAAGVRHIVDLSGEPDSWWGTVSNAVEESGLAWTHLWPADFMENSVSWSQQIRATSTVREPRPEMATAPVAMDDIAAVAATALLDDDHLGRAYPLAGPEVLTRAEQVAQIADAIGREITFLRSDRAETIAALAPSMGDNTEWYVDNVLLGYSPPTDSLPITSVQDITGRPATTFRDWLKANADQFLDG
ncbi:NAD(P)H-binding protein [Nocardia sp. NPDC023988]|uniref:SDR family oxidoreductase n=1 Tax=unclassified Nocardia TaxID=2637762 RepID=UPI0033E36405